MKSRLIAMLLTGVGLALALLIGVQVSQSLRPDIPEPTSEPEDMNRTVAPLVFRSVSEQFGQVRLTGSSEAEARVTLLNGDRIVGQTEADDDGRWRVDVPVGPDDVLALDAAFSVGEGARIRSDETVIRVPSPPSVATDETVMRPPALIMLTAPGGPSRIIQSPFRGLPTEGPISMGPIDYDRSGGAIFSGSSEKAGIVRLYADRRLVGEQRVSAGGSWFFIAAETLPTGRYDIRAEFVGSEDQARSVVTVPFERLSPAEPMADTGLPVRVRYAPYRWHVVRDLIGGGQQSTVIFAPEDADPIIPQGE